MFPRTLVLSIVLSCAVLCSTTTFQEGTTQASTVKITLTQTELLLSVAVCMTATVVIVLLPTIVYYKYFSKGMEGETF